MSAPRLAIDPVRAESTIHRVGARAAKHPVGAVASVQRIVPAAAAQSVVAVEAIEHVVARAAREVVASVRAVEPDPGHAGKDEIVDPDRAGIDHLENDLVARAQPGRGYLDVPADLSDVEARERYGRESAEIDLVAACSDGEIILDPVDAEARPKREYVALGSAPRGVADVIALEIQRVLAGAAGVLVGAGSAPENVVAVFAKQLVVTGAAEDRVVARGRAGSAAISANQQVIATAALNHIVAAACPDLIGAIVAIEHVGSRIAENDVRCGTPDDVLDGDKRIRAGFRPDRQAHWRCRIRISAEMEERGECRRISDDRLARAIRRREVDFQAARCRRVVDRVSAAVAAIVEVVAIAAPGTEVVIARAAMDHVDAGKADDGIVAVAGRDRVVAIAGSDRIGSRGAGEGVVVDAAGDREVLALQVQVDDDARPGRPPPTPPRH